MNDIAPAQRLDRVLDRFEQLAIAVSGGVDSVTLAAFAHRKPGLAVTVIHAASPAVPEEATARVRGLSDTEGWTTLVIGTGEFEDSRYRDNASNRCYFCKTNLYDRIRTLTPHVIASGANLDDLGDYRPGLLAAAERQVVHPLIEAEMAKADIRALSRELGLGSVAELPAQPCLASRVETGIAIDARDLAFIEKAERHLADIAASGVTLRCRITRSGVVLELGDGVSAQKHLLVEITQRLCAEAGRVFVGARPYSRGAMFMRP
ncbi:adenine nucleotide alpha hydrolase [Mesorhizobium sp. M7A.F.Ca.CA.002.05.1.1]|uniref:adenine nucleotide alpha hydrolase n=1 Tax=Mesorhizobium sp. M7A.F.Ca.CA.002.05.1.1 TaxID=2496704 RepID=UPI000FCA9D39|nr:adenine nucleotide alpha hydrolase [Mesorhizobium sp. M7A.F.Ca.CA.002.05.1.1]RVA13731.1 adenine nucleotide alpha hydrolase [Mesorhizobium sp. M7A.F.Ca.CA.002.05.1.1]